jgi:two-component system, chemotaxis family, CheB/CheR fusion protein
MADWSRTTPEAFLESHRPATRGIVMVDAMMPGMGGWALMDRLRVDGYCLPAILITGQGDVGMAVRALRTGAADFIEKPISEQELPASIDRAWERIRDSVKPSASRSDATTRLAGLTARQRLIMDLVLAAQPSKIIAADLGISQRTVEKHRAEIMRKTGSKSLSELIRLSVWSKNDIV